MTPPSILSIPIRLPAVEPAFTTGGALAAPDLEKRFRLTQLSADARLSATTILIAQAAYLFLLNDYRLFGTGQLFWSLAAARTAFVFLSIVVVIQLLRQTSIRRHDLALALWCLALAALNTFVVATRPPTLTSQFLPVFVIILLFYVGIALPLWLQALAAVFAGGLILLVPALLHPQLHDVQWTTLAVTLICANLFGIFTARTLQIWKRRQFVALVVERELNSRLEKALSEIRTLEGMLPICMHCKRLRDDSGHWHPVEVYVRDRTHAEFSHGICPDCILTHHSGH